MKATLPRLPLVVAIGLLIPAAALLRGADWPDWRGPARTGTSTETGLPSSWSPSGQNLAWKAPYGGRSGPVIFGDRLYLQNTSGEGEQMQERLMCFHADTGKLLWEYKYNIFTSDVPPHRIAWASPVVDAASGNVFAFSGNGLLMSLSRDGKLLWERSLAEEFGMWTTHGGRVSSPIIDGDQLIVSGLMFSWGQHAGGAHRYISFDKINRTRQLDQLAGGTADRHHLRQPVRLGRQRDADVLLRRQRRRHARAQDCHRRKGLELAGEPAWPEHSGARHWA